MRHTYRPKTIAVFTIVLVLLLVWQSAWLLAQTYTVDSVPNRKVLANQLVSNPDHLITPATEAQLNQLLDSLEKKTSSQVAVVLLHSIGEESEFDFAQALFDKWKIGQAQNDNGLLILFVEDKRVIRFHTGLGLEGILPDVICKRIQMKFMVPSFKEGNIDTGIREGVKEVVKIISDPTYAEEVKTEVNPPPVVWNEETWAGIGILLAIPWLLIFTIAFFVKRKSGFANSTNGPGDTKPTSRVTKGGWVLMYILGGAFMLVAAASLLADGWLFLAAMYGYFLLLTLAKRIRLERSTKKFLAKEEYHTLHQFYSDNKGFWLTMAIFFPLPFAFLFVQYLTQRKSFRTHPRKCQSCGQKMTRLDDKAEDEYLQKSMLLEEELKSVDYDVWTCSHCNNLSIEVYYNEKTPYESCPKCKTIAFHTTGSRTITAATTSHSGSEEIYKECKFCQHKKTETRSIPRIEVSSSSSSSSSSGSSGGSFGGGSSGGGGASSSW